MATAGGNATANAGGEASGGSSVPQWKRDLIQRRRQQSKVFASNGASVSSVTSASATTSDDGAVATERNAATEQRIADALRAAREDAAPTVALCGCGIALCPCPPYRSRRPPAGGATTAAGATVATTAVDRAPVARNMRLEVGLPLRSDAEDVVNGATAKFADAPPERKLSGYVGEENGERADGGKSPRAIARTNESGAPSLRRGEVRAVLTGRRGSETARGGSSRPSMSLSRAAPPSRARASGEDAESDSSEELQYGPGIVNKLRCKYLNLTLRETGKSRASVQRFRRAASLEDLLERDDGEASGRERTTGSGRYAKRSEGGSGGGSGAVAAPKADRYRNAFRGNDSMKRARSVETLMRYNSVTADEATTARQVPVARPVTNGVRQEPVNDHIVLVDRTFVKIESRLSELDRPKPINKPKRIKPVLAETERPPPDLVRTTMRIFESSARRLKPKGEVAAKVATFRTINDTFKAQKKLAQKPPLQPKPFINGAARPGAAGGVGPPKKIALPHKLPARKPTAELIETRDGKEEHRVDGVIAEPIARSVSSVVSKFQQIEKSHSPSPSPEPPSCHKLKFSPANSPEPPQTCKSRSAVLEIAVKSPPVTPVLSPRILSPRLQSPSSPVKDVRCQDTQSPSYPVKDLIRVQMPSPLHRPPLPSSPVKGESSKTTEPEPEALCPLIEKETPRTSVESPRQTRVPESPAADVEWREEAGSSLVAFNDGEKNVDEEIVDGPRTISKTALDNIGKAGTTVQFNFGDESTSDKSYLPGAKRNGQESTDEPVPEEDCCAKTECRSKVSTPASVMTSEASSRLREQLEPEEEGEDIEEKPIVPENKPIGAICSLGLIKTATIITTTTTTTTTMISSAMYSQGSNEAKTMIRCQQKSEFSPPQKQIGIIRPLVSTKTTQHPQQNLSNRELEKNLINRVKSIEQPTKVVVSLKSADEIQPAKRTSAGSGGGLWDTKPWNQQNNTMVFNFSNRKDVPDYIENDGLIIRRKREKSKVVDGGIIVLDATLDASTTDDAEWEFSGGPPSPCDVSFLNDNVLINGHSNLSRTPRNHKHRIQFDDTATRTFEYPSEASILEGETSSVDGETSSSAVEKQPGNNKVSSTGSSTTNMPSLLGGGGLASYTPSKVDLASEGFELGVTRAVLMVPTPAAAATATTTGQTENASEVELRPAQDAGAWGSETTGDLLY